LITPPTSGILPPENRIIIPQNLQSWQMCRGFCNLAEQELIRSW
jgi:hypothetical protein